MLVEHPLQKNEGMSEGSLASEYAGSISRAAPLSPKGQLHSLLPILRTHTFTRDHHVGFEPTHPFEGTQCVVFPRSLRR